MCFILLSLTTTSSTWGASSTGNQAVFSQTLESKYYDAYTTEDTTTACNGSVCYGHGLSETSGWYNDYFGFLVKRYPWLVYSSYYANGKTTGIYYVSYLKGNADDTTSFRTVLLKENYF